MFQRKNITDLYLIVLSDAFQLAFVFVYGFFDVVHFGTQGDGLVNLAVRVGKKTTRDDG